jgi:hypothetical protein
MNPNKRHGSVLLLDKNGEKVSASAIFSPQLLYYKDVAKATKSTGKWS